MSATFPAKGGTNHNQLKVVAKTRRRWQQWWKQQWQWKQWRWQRRQRRCCQQWRIDNSDKDDKSGICLTAKDFTVTSASPLRPPPPPPPLPLCQNVGDNGGNDDNNHIKEEEAMMGGLCASCACWLWGLCVLVVRVLCAPIVLIGSHTFIRAPKSQQPTKYWGSPKRSFQDKLTYCI